MAFKWRVEEVAGRPSRPGFCSTATVSCMGFICQIGRLGQLKYASITLELQLCFPHKIFLHHFEYIFCKCNYCINLGNKSTLFTVLKNQDNDTSPTLACESAINTSAPVKCVAATGPGIPKVYLDIFL